MILLETLEQLEKEGLLAGRSVQRVCLTQYFHVVELDDGSVGAAMNYAHLTVEEVCALRGQVTALLPGDPLLLHWLFDEDRPWRRLACSPEPGRLLTMSLQVALLSALSAPLFHAGGGEGFVVESHCSEDFFQGARRAVVVGFGGYLRRLVRDEAILELHVVDLKYPDPEGCMEKEIAGYRQEYSRKNITISDGSDIASHLRRADLVTITGSALCNGTLESLLRHAQPQTRVIVQGQSAALHPRALFRRGVDLVVTTIKPPRLVELAERDPVGDPLKPLLEGGLPVIYGSPVSHQKNRPPACFGGNTRL